MKKSSKSPGRKQDLQRMRPDHERLSFLTVNQALESIKVMTGLSMNLEDLISQCEDGYCIAYIGGDPLKGLTQVAEPNEQAVVVFGAGSQRVINTERLQGLALEPKLHLFWRGLCFRMCPMIMKKRCGSGRRTCPRQLQD